MLTIHPINYKNYNSFRATEKKHKNAPSQPENEPTLAKLPLYSITNLNNISFKKRIAKDIEREDYINMTEAEKEENRELYRNFYRLIDIDDLYKTKDRNENSTLPLSSDSSMENFLRVSSGYNKYRDNKIICVGRSPKWFLNASLWMEDGIRDYDFLAFSSNWFNRQNTCYGPRQYFKAERFPTEEERAVYRNLLKEKNCLPSDIVRAAKETGKPVIITDYIHSGCGLASFLDLLARFAKEDGILDEFANSIKLVTLSSTDYFDDLGYDYYYYYPQVVLPEILQPYAIEQEYHDMSATVMKEILIDKNTNECRSTYYPHQAWTKYHPDQLKIGLISNEVIENIEDFASRNKIRFSDGMKDFRNLMHFRICDALEKAGRLKKGPLKTGNLKLAL